MADPIVPTPEQIKQVQDFEAAAKSAGITASEAWTRIKNGAVQMAEKAAGAFINLEEYLKKVGTDLTGMSTSTDAAKLTLLALTGAAINTRTAFANLADVDYKNINTFHNQIDELKASLGLGGAQATIAGSAISGMFEKFRGKIPDTAFDLIKGKGAAAMVQFMDNLAKKSDNMTRLQAGILAVSASTGNLGNIYEKAGPGLRNINELLSRHQEAMHATVGATGASSEAVETYYMALGKVPGALESTVSSGTAAGGSMNMLTAVMKMAAGNGRTVADVTKDLGEVFTKLNMKGEPALTFINRFSELSNKLGIEFNDMKAALMGGVEAFKNLTDAGKAQEGMTEGLANMMNTYAGALMNAGMSGQHAAETVKGMAGAMAGLTTVQKAFLSAQTGGPGGLLGGLQIEKMIRSGPEGIMQVQKKLMETIQKQTGPLMSMEEAISGGQAGAARFEKQRMMLTQGPMGAALGIKTSEDATRMLEAMKGLKEGKEIPKDLLKGPAGLQDAMSKGTSIQERNYTELSEINKNIDGVNRSTDFLAAGFAATNFGIALGKESAELSKLQLTRKEDMRLSAVEGGKKAELYGTEIKGTGEIRATSDEFRGKAITDIVKHFTSVIKDVGFKEGFDKLASAFKGGSKTDINAANAEIAAQIKSGMESKDAAKIGVAKLASTELNKVNAEYNASLTTRKPAGISEEEKKKVFTPATASGVRVVSVPENEKMLPPGSPLALVNRAAEATKNTRSKSAEAPTPPHTVAVTETGAEGMKITVNVSVDKQNPNTAALKAGAPNI